MGQTTHGPSVTPDADPPPCVRGRSLTIPTTSKIYAQRDMPMGSGLQDSRLPPCPVGLPLSLCCLSGSTQRQRQQHRHATWNSIHKRDSTLATSAYTPNRAGSGRNIAPPRHPATAKNLSGQRLYISTSWFSIEVLASSKCAVRAMA